MPSMLDDLQEPLIEGYSLLSGAKSSRAPEKRKRGANDAGISKDGAQSQQKKSRKANKDADLDIGAGLNNAFATMNSQLLADYLAQRTKHFESDLSAVELQDKYIPAMAIRDTTSWNMSRDLNNLPGYLENFSSNSTKLWSASKKNGSPHTIIVAAAGLRAADIVRSVRRFQSKDITVAKLFAKHIKFQDAIKFLKSHRTGIAVGTPVRLKDLMENGALQLDRLERIVIDASHIDQKKRGILDMKETQIELLHLLNQDTLSTRYASENEPLELLFY